jgi:hypothetical protein
MPNETGNNPQHRQSQRSPSNQNTDTGSLGSRFEDRSGVRTNAGSSMTDMQGRERFTHTNQGERPGSGQTQNTGNTATTPPRQSSNDRNVIAHNSGDQPGERDDQDRSWNHQLRRKAS